MDKKAFIAVLASLLLASIMGILSLHAAEANPYWGWVPGVVPAEPSKDKPILVIETPSNCLYKVPMGVKRSEPVVRADYSDVEP